MSGISITVGLDDLAARERLRSLVERMDRRRPFYADVGEIMVASTGRRFAAETGPDGRRWTPLARATIKARQRRGRAALSILRERGHLAGSINYVATDSEVRIGTPVESAAIHQLGGTIEKPARAAKIYRLKDKNGNVGRRFVKKSKANHVTDVTIPAHTIRIPARPYLGISAEDQTDFMAAAERWLFR